MPRTAQSNGIKPYLRALKVIKLGVPVTPQEINDCVGTGDYAAKYISFLRNRNGFEFTIQKDGRRVLSYTLIKEPADAESLRNLQPKVANAKVAKTVKKVDTSVPLITAAAAHIKAKAPVATKKSVAEIKASNLEKLKAVAAKRKSSTKKKVREFDDVTETFGTTGEIGTSFNVDGDWDSVEGLDLKNLL
jgi:hypothetical protein